MYPLIFAVLWTVLSMTLIVAGFDQIQAWERSVALIFPLAGCLFIHHAWRRLRRQRSLRIEVDRGVALYVWIDLDGTERRATTDPRDDWDGDGGDGDGDGGGD